MSRQKKDLPDERGANGVEPDTQPGFAIERVLAADSGRPDDAQTPVDFICLTEAVSDALVKALPSPVVLLNLQGTVLVWNPATEAVTGWSADEVVGTVFPAISRRFQLKFDKILEKAAAGRSVIGEELRGVKKDGTQIRIQFASSPVYNVAGEITGILITFIDQSAREKRIERELAKGNIFIEKVLDNLPVGVAVNTIDKGNIGYANRKFLDIYGGWSQSDFSDLETFFARVYPDADEREDVRQMILRDLATGDREKMRWDDMRITCKDGTEKIVAVRNIPMPEMNLMISTVQDVTDQKLTEQALRESERRYQVMAESSPVGIFRLDTEGRCSHVNKAWREIAGLTVTQVLGRNWDLAVHPGDVERLADLWATAVQERRTFKAECRFKRSSGLSTWVLCQIEPIFDRDHRLEGYIGSITDISRRKRTEEEIRQLAYYDTLTLLPNRYFFLEQLERALATAERTRRHVALLFCDLDNFKDINDTLGHDKGDVLLKAIAGRLSDCIRRGDTLCRLGGDEFVLLLPSVRRDREIVSVARKIQQAMAKPFDLDGHEVYTTTSIGIAVYPEDGQEVQTLLKHADMAMYVAKGKGRNRYQFFSEDMNQRAQERLALEGGLRQAISREELSLAWQPQYDLTNGKLVGVEALLRWYYPQRGQVPPAQFIRLAEETGLIHSIGEWVLRQACTQAQQWRAAGIRDLRVAVNLSASQFMEPDLVGTVQRVLEETGLDPAWLELEITESMLMRDADVAMRTLHKLRKDGVRLALDDFGTGYSSLLYLRNYPIGRIKIAREFISDLGMNKADRAIAGTVIDMAKNLGMTAIAEGVETAEQVAILKELGCPEVQGFYFSKPLSAKAFGEALG